MIQDWVHVIFFSDTASNKAAVKMFNLIATEKILSIFATISSLDLSVTLQSATLFSAKASWKIEFRQMDPWDRSIKIQHGTIHGTY